LQCKTCTRCQVASEGDLLNEIALGGKHSLEDILKQHEKRDSPLSKISRKYRDERLEEERAELSELEARVRQFSEEFSFEAVERFLKGEDVDKLAGEMRRSETVKAIETKIQELKWQPDEVTIEDAKKALNEFEKRGLVKISGDIVKVTSKGANILAANALERTMQGIGLKDSGTNLKETSSSNELSLHTRKYEVGDDYARVEVEKTALNAIKRAGKLRLIPEDFEFYEELREVRLSVGLLIDESASMKGGEKLSAAVETALALSHLIHKNPRDSLRIFIFSEAIKEIPYWAIVNEEAEGITTDIRAAMRAFRKLARDENTDRQAYLITDTDPNTEDGQVVGFDRAGQGIIQEALRYRREGIGLNIIMLDETPHLKELASTLARKNLGRVFFSSPRRLGQVVVEDYLKVRNR
jgi:uncharacterized protein with von Willebrand factor type A (vWA) domain